VSTAAERWRQELASWALPDHLTAAVAESPWPAPARHLTRRADVAAPGGRSYERAAAALAPTGTVLDVGCGAGAASLPLAPMITALTGVDSDPRMLEAFAERAANAGLPAHTVQGSWPAVTVEPRDVVVCHHVFYNAPDLAEFALALHTSAHRRVVVELTPRHPLVPLNPLWMRLHGLTRPAGPTAQDARDVLREAGIEANLERWTRVRTGYESFEELVATTRRRLCLTPDRDDELIAALHAQPPERDEELVTLWWDV
jgi:2-polyprenyl-3-methyl-5-hydroxy-6-metoxy-1,4-benzoquinol methylase